MLENQHTIDTANRKIVPPPSILEMEPKKARRAWARFICDQDLTAHLWGMAERVRLSIGELILNEGSEAEEVSRRELARRLEAFDALRSRDV